MTIDIYMMRLSLPSRAVRMAARQLNIDLNLKPVDLASGEHLQLEFLKLNPAHTVPTIDDNGFVLWESRAIMAYLCNKYAPDSPLYPKDPKKRAAVDRWLNFDVSLMQRQRDALTPKIMGGVDAPEEKVNTFRTQLELFDLLIGDNKYLTGNELTIADFSVLGTTNFVEFAQLDVTDCPNFKRWQSALIKEMSYYKEINDISNEEIQAFIEKY